MPRGAAGRVAVKSSGGLTRGRTDPSLGPKKKRSLSPNVIGKRFSQGGRREGGGRISTRGTGPTDEFKAEVAGLRSALKERHRRTMEAQRCLLNPDGGKLYMWDGVTTSALAYTALVTPIEVAFVGNDGGVDGWFVINRVIDLIFIADFIIQFFIMVPAPKSWTQGETGLEGKPKGPMVASHGIYYVTDHREIAKAYIASVWFTLDIFSVLPSIVDYVEVSINTGDSLQGFMLFRVLRAFRLFKLARLVRASRIYQRILSRISLSHITLTQLKCVLAVILTAHWFACIFAMMATLHPNPADTYWFTRDFCWDESRGPASNASEALAELAKTEGFLGACQVDPLNFYIASFTWAIMVITGTGGTDEFPSATSVGENVVIVVLVMIAALIWTMVLATFW